VRYDQTDRVVAHAAFELLVDRLEAFGAEAIGDWGDGGVLIAIDP
jgi:hypothetical protein